MGTLVAVALLSATSLAAQPLWLAREITPDMIHDGPSFMGRWKQWPPAGSTPTRSR